MVEKQSRFQVFLKRKDIEFSARRYGIDALGAMAQGLFASLLVGTILSTLGEQLGITFLVQAGGWAKAATGPAMAVAIGHALHCPPLVLFSLAAVGGAANELGGAGGPLAVLAAYLVVRRRNTANNVIDIMSMLPYIIPGSVVGIALIMAFNQKPLILTGTMIIMVIALVIRRLPYTIRSSVATLQQIPITVEEAAISLGASKVKTFFLVTVPMMANGIISGAILSWVTIITELSTAICLYTVRTQTLTLAIYVYVSRGNDGIAAALATILSLTTVVSLCIFMKVSKSKDVTL